MNQIQTSKINPSFLKLSFRKALVMAFFAVLIFFSFASAARADYYAQGILESKNMLSGATVTAINSFQTTASLPSGTSASVKFSQDKVNYYNSSGTEGGWDSITNGTTNISLSSLSWTGGLLFYKLKLETTNVAATPAVSQVLIDYDGTAVPPISGTTYYDQGILKSTNLLSGADVTAINGFQVTADIPAGTTASVKFSQDNVNYYNSGGTEDGWDNISNGTTNIDLSGLNWSGGSLFYKIKLGTVIDNALTAAISGVQVDYDGTPVPPLSGSTYYAQGSFVSTDLLAGSGANFIGSERFGYNLSLPYGTTVSAQFSQDGISWYNSSGTLWGWDSLSSGDHLTADTSLDLFPLNWKGASNFYYKLKFATAVDNSTSPILSDAGLRYFSTTLNSPDASPGSKTTINASQTGRKTNNLVGMWSFDGPDVVMSTNTAYDRGGSHNGTISGAVPAIGKNGQAMDFDGTSSHISLGAVGSGIKTISFWMKADDTTSRKIMDFDGTDQIEINGSSQILATSFPGTTIIYVDGVVGFAINSDWHLVTITDTTGVNGSAADIGRVGSGYFDGKIDEVRFYDRVLAAGEVENLYRLGKIEIIK